MSLLELLSAGNSICPCFGLAVLFACCPASGMCADPGAGAQEARAEDRKWVALRNEMVSVLLNYDIRDKTVLDAMRKIRRHEFIPERYLSEREAYGNHPAAIGHNQTISQPYIVAYMTEQLRIRKGEKILEIGTGSGYQAAVLAECGAEVFSIEIIPELAEHAGRALRREGYPQVRLKCGDGYEGWPEHAPFDAIIVTCAPENIPKALADQLKDGGRMILPLGESGVQRLAIVSKKSGKLEVRDDLPVRFVPMVRGTERRPEENVE